MGFLNYEQTVFCRPMLWFYSNDKSLFLVADFNQSPNVMALFWITTYPTAISFSEAHACIKICGNGKWWQLSDCKSFLVELDEYRRAPTCENTWGILPNLQGLQMLVYENPSLCAARNIPSLCNRCETNTTDGYLQHLQKVVAP